MYLGLGHSPIEIAIMYIDPIVLIASLDLLDGLIDLPEWNLFNVPVVLAPCTARGHPIRNTYPFIHVPRPWSRNTDRYRISIGSPGGFTPRSHITLYIFR